MNRRTAVRNLAFIAGAAVWLPSCLAPAKKVEQKASIALKHLAVNAHQEKVLAEVCETILPKTETPGAKDLKLHLYVLKMLDDCCGKKERQAFLAGMRQLEFAAKRQYRHSFLACSAPQKLALLQSIEQQPKADRTALTRFYQTTKRLTVAGYTGSKYFLTTQVVYELVPSRYNGYFPTKDVVLSKKHNGQS